MASVALADANFWRAAWKLFTAPTTHTLQCASTHTHTHTQTCTHIYTNRDRERGIGDIQRLVSLGKGGDGVEEGRLVLRVGCRGILVTGGIGSSRSQDTHA